jgi:ligand-binding sensor domain-containing protein
MRRQYFASGVIQGFVLIISLACPLLGQPVDLAFEQIPIAVAHCFLNDSNGFLWIGSQEGLARYDGYTLKFYTHIPFDSISLSDDWVSVIKEDKNGDLWVGTWGGALNHFNQRTEKFTRFLQETNSSKSISCKNIRTIIVNDDGTLWIGTQERGLLYMSFGVNGNAVYRTYDFSSAVDAKHKERDNFVWSLLKDSENKLWIGTLENGLICLDPATDETQHYKNDPRNPASLSSNSVTSLCEDDSGNIWIGSGNVLSNIKGNGLSRFVRKTRQFITYRHDPADSNSICSNSPANLLIDHKNTLWIGTPDNGLCSIQLAQLYDGGKPVFTKHRNVGGSIINSTYEDRLGNIWVALWAHHMSKYDRLQSPFIWYRRIPGNPNSLSSSGIECIYVDKEDNIWFGHHFRGISRFDPETGMYKHYKPDPKMPHGISSTWVSSICEDNDGMLWFGTFDNGIDIFNPSDESFKHIKADPTNTFGLRSNKINFLLRTSSGDIWVSTRNGGLQLYDLENQRFKFFDVDSSTSDDETTTRLYEDSRGTLWIGTMNNGLYRLTIENKQITYVKHYKHNPTNRNSLSNNSIMDIIQSKILDTNALWIATGSGLNKFDMKTETITHFFKKDGLPHDMVLKVLEDNEGNTWASTAYELCVYNAKTGKFSSYGEDDGLPFTGFGGGRQNSAVTRDRQLLFGSGKGALGFYSEEAINSPNIPQIRLTDFKIFHESAALDTAIHLKQIITLNHEQNAFSFEFTDLNFSTSKRNQFAYKLQGLYDDWIYIGNARLASFTNIDPGKYIFNVKGFNHHGIENETSVSIVLIITPPWWATWWFRAIVSITIIGIVYGIYRYRLNKALEMGRLRLRIANDLHDDIGSDLSSLALESDLIARRLPEGDPGRKRLQTVGRTIRSAADNLRDVVWIVSPDQDRVQDLLERMREVAAKMLTGIQYEFRCTGVVLSGSLDVELKRHVLMMFKEMLHNVVCHARASRVDVEFQHGGGRIRLCVRDDGVGFDPSGKHSGRGLRSLQARASAIGGTVRIESTQGQGTVVCLEADIIHL